MLASLRREAGQGNETQGPREAAAIRGTHLARGLHRAALTSPRSSGATAQGQRLPSILRGLPPAWCLRVPGARAHVTARAPPPPLLPPLLLPHPRLLVCVPVLPRKMLQHRPVEAPFQVVRHLGVLCGGQRCEPPTRAGPQTTSPQSTASSLVPPACRAVDKRRDTISGLRNRPACVAGTGVPRAQTSTNLILQCQTAETFK